jgi:predicted ATPase
MSRLRRLQARIEAISCHIIFGLSDPKLGSEQLNPTLFELSLSSRAREQLDETNRESQIRLIRKRTVEQQAKSQDPQARFRLITEFDIELDKESTEDLRDDYSDAKAFGCFLDSFLPTSLVVSFDEKAEIIRSIVGALTRTPRHRFERELSGQGTQIPKNIIIDLVKIMPELERTLAGFNLLFHEGTIPLNEVLDRLRRVRTNLAPEIVTAIENATGNILTSHRGIIIAPLPGRTLDSAVDFTRDFFSSQVKYLGPLREEPKAIYPIQYTSDPQDIGLHGEHTAAVLHRNRYLDVKYLPSSNFTDQATSTAEQTIALEDAVFDWLEYLDVAKKVDTSDEGKFGYSLKVIMAGGSVPHDLTHVGVGVSQVLPIVVMCLLAARDTTIILEQPELHLNPKVQTRLADFFLSMAMLRKQCLIETHSEYLINRLRLRSVLAEGSSVSELLKLYFVEMAGGLTSYRDVKINEYGTILDWPSGFFDQNQREIESIILAASQKR